MTGAMRAYAKPDHKRIARCIGYSLTLNTFDAWADLSVVLAARLNDEERTALAYSALRSLDANTAHRAASLAIFGPIQMETAA